MSAGSKQASAGTSDDKTADGEQPAAPQSNFERLNAHLARDSLAAKLVTAYAAPGDATPADALAKVAGDRLGELERSYDKPKDKQD